MKINVNLIPPSRREEIIGNLRLKKVAGIIFALLFVLVGFFVILFSFKYIIKIGDVFYRQEQVQKDSSAYSQIEDFDKKFSEMNKNVADIAMIEDDQLYWSKIFLKLNNKIPPEITLNSFSNENYEITIRGVSQGRENLIELKNSLENEDCFSAVNLPLSDLANKSDIEFQMSFVVKKECLR